MSDPLAFATTYHAPVLARELVALLGGADRTVLDGTLGGGGHSAAFLESGATVLGVDRDPRAIVQARARLADEIAAGRFDTLAANYADADAALEPSRRFHGILLDLGVSSHQLDDDTRGFSFREGAPLDMRMESDGLTAAEWLNEREERELTQALREYGDEPKAGRMAREIVRRREHRPFATADDLVGAIRATLGPRSGPSDFARLFQAVRIAVNDELDGLARALPALRDRLHPDGVFAVIAYHSGEDRLVKHAFREWSTACICPPAQPVCTCRGRALGVLVTRKPILASEEEIAANPRARSAHLRVFRRAGAA
ncbi:MAG: 16S rRNA (cytosine(1402)-N(4))-methyltransferase RsmH [Gemmatimonadaceae bacterium]|nr:16S rRNA (cytosine(1402)-N(4))-methyltransferase RsmH [Gemmatimonadaceae bacterium]